MEKAPLEDLVGNINKKGFACTQLALKKAIYDFNADPEAMTPGMTFHIKDIFHNDFKVQAKARILLKPSPLGPVYFIMNLIKINKRT
jgi:hypothetical protein